MEDPLTEGGPWLGAARSSIQRKRCWGNGERVTWGSNDVIDPPLTVREVENIAADAVRADRQRPTAGRKLLTGETVTLCAECVPFEGGKGSTRWKCDGCGKLGPGCVEVKLQVVK